MSLPPPIFLFTDFGYAGPYVGQMTGAILAIDPGLTVINLMHDAPAMRPDLAAYLLPAVCRELPPRAIIVAVVDPGVGGERAALRVDAGDHVFIGPDNGLLSRLPDIRRVEIIDWRPATLSNSFHGRDLFAPVAAMCALGRPPETTLSTIAAMTGHTWPTQLDQVIYIDAYGNCMTGMSSENLHVNSRLRVGNTEVRWARTFGEAASDPFWYANSQGLVEIAANRASLADLLSLAPGDKILLD